MNRYKAAGMPAADLRKCGHALSKLRAGAEPGCYFPSPLNTARRLLRMLSWRCADVIFAPVRSVT